MRYKYFIGIDISKETLDFTLLKEDSEIYRNTLANSSREIARWLATLSREFGVRKTNALFCTEHMGLYQEHLVAQLLKRQAPLWLESPLQIKKSLGMQRGKNDQLDSLRIARYAYLFRSQARLWEPPRPVLVQLKLLSGLRSRLISCEGQLSKCLSEHTAFLRDQVAAPTSRNCAASLSALKKDLQKTNEAIVALIKCDEHLNHLYRILTSIDYVGQVLASELLIVTNEFKKFDSPKKFAGYCGVAPFEHTSGTSVQGKTRTSKMANKKMKTALHMASIAALGHEGELRDYYLRKVGEGKPKMSVINAIRNKLIHRVFACVREDRVFEKQGRPLALQAIALKEGSKEAGRGSSRSKSRKQSPVM